MGATTSQVPLSPPGAAGSNFFTPPRPPCICQSCWERPFAAHFGLFDAPEVVNSPPSPMKFRGDYRPEPRYAGGYQYTTSWKAVKSGAGAGCLWCQLLLSHCYYPSKKQLKIRVGTRTGTFSLDDTPRNTQNLMIAVDGGRSTRVPILEGYVYTAAGDPAAAFIAARSPILDVGSIHALSLAQSCLDECVHGHTHCIALSGLASSNLDPPLPTRLVDCLHPDHPYLASTAGRHGKYLALSYVWGEAQPHSTTMSNVSAYADGIDPSRLPQTILDAMHVTHALGFQYLWLDTLCIIQDSEEDRRHELAHMHNIYRYAHLTIIAASAEKVSQGFLQDRLPGRPRTRFGKVAPPEDIALPFICPAVDETTAQQVGSVHLSALFSTMTYGHTELYRHAWEPISTRAWCMQEYLMSPRALLFTSQTLQFRCQTATKNIGDSFYSPSASSELGAASVEQRLPEALFLPEPPLLGFKRSYAWLEVYDAWLRVVQDYTRCLLTFPADKLPACGAIAAEFQRVLRSDYLAGLWRDTLIHELLWHRQANRASRPLTAYRAPSWSWAAFEGPVSMPRAEEVGRKTLAEVVRCEVVLKDAMLPFGQVTGGSLVLRSALIRSVLRPFSKESESVGRMIFPQFAQQARRWRLAGGSRDEGEEKVQFGKELFGEPSMDWEDDMDISKLWIVPLTRQGDDDGDPVIEGLIVALASDGTAEHERKVYRRVGTFEIEDGTVERLGWDMTNLPMVDIELV